jgi:hypothetical protein
MKGAFSMDSNHTARGRELQVLSYLETSLPGYPYDDEIDSAFVGELLSDFTNIDILDEIKAFRWYHNNRPAAHVSNIRLALRRWVARGKPRKPIALYS